MSQDLDDERNRYDRFEIGIVWAAVIALITWILLP